MKFIAEIMKINTAKIRAAIIDNGRIGLKSVRLGTSRKYEITSK